jgi:hypothetical protein
MILPIHTSLRDTQRLGRVALTALVIGLGGAAIATLPLGNLAFAGNGNGNGGGKGGGNGGGHSHDGGHGGGSGGGNGSGKGPGEKGQDRSNDGAGQSAKAGVSDADDSSVDDSTDDDAATTDDGSMSPHNLGKLNGFFHASSNGLANASPNSAIGRISHTFKEALSDFAEASETPSDPNDPNATSPSGPSVDDLGAILAGATNKPVTSTQVKAIIDRLAEENPDDQSLSDFADSVDDATSQDIADAANAVKSGETTDDSVDGTDTSSGDSTDDGTDAGTDDTAGSDSSVVTTSATN